MSGASESRPGLTALMQDARRAAFDVVVVFRFDRFARSVKQLVLALEEFRTLGVGFVLTSGSRDFLRAQRVRSSGERVRAACHEVRCCFSPRCDSG